jgi:RNA polymerase sigma factor (sigma-70 family)
MQTSLHLDSSDSICRVEQVCWDQVSDEELLEVYLRSRSSDVVAVLVRRHAPLVASVVSRVLRNADQREEAFQATFLVLIQSLNKIRKAASLASYLYGVAFRVSKRIRQKTSKDSRRSNHHGETLETLEAAEMNSFEALSLRLQTAVLDEELQLLPESIRGPIVEHFMVGKTVPQVAQSMHLSVSAVEGRIKRGKQILRSRLASRGVSLTVVFVAIQIPSATMTASAMEALTNTTIDLCRRSQAGDSTFHDVDTTHSSLQQVVKGELNMQSIARPSWLIWTGTVCLVSVVGLGMLEMSNGSAPPQERRALSATETDDVNAVLLQFGGQPPTPSKTETQPAKPSDSNSATQSKMEIVKWEATGDIPGWLREDADTDVEMMIREKLRERTKAIAIDGLPLSQVATLLSKEWDVDIIIDERALSDASIMTEEPVTVRRNGMVKYKDLLRQILDPLDLTYVIRYDAILITTKEGSRSDIVRFYDLSFVLPDNGLANELVESIQALVTPDVWEVSGGTSTMSVLGSMLIVRAEEESHEAIEDFLRKAAKQSPGNMKPQSSKPAKNPMGMGGMM